MPEGGNRSKSSDHDATALGMVFHEQRLEAAISENKKAFCQKFPRGKQAERQK
jgi:hypothetical protein